jgi:two-component system NtrC family sensor kinase
MQSERLSAAGILVGGIAHQLNNPLTGVLGFSQLLLRNNAVEGKVRQSAERIHEEALRAKQIVANLLSFARHRRPKLDRVDLNAVIRGTLEAMGEELSRQAIDVTALLAADLPSISADRLQLRQLFTSLFNHALHAMGNGTGAARKALKVWTLRNERGQVEVRVADNGPGVPPELRRQVFDLLLGADESRDSPIAALSMAFAIVQDHHGEILVTETEPPPGATFVIQLPVADPAGAPASGAS